jgi:hypothetical protein
MTKKNIESRKDDKIEQEITQCCCTTEHKKYLFIGNLTDDQLDEITHFIHTAFEKYDGSYDNVVLVCERGIKFGGY